MTRAVASVIDRIMLAEGGIGRVPGESWITRFGQTPQWLDDHGFPPPDTAEQAIANYESWITEKTRLGEVIARNPVIGWLVADYAVQSGLGLAVKVLQRALEVVDDGVIGPQTLAAVTTCDGHEVAKRVLAERIRHYFRLVGSTKTDRRAVAAGWGNRLAGQLEEAL